MEKPFFKKFDYGNVYMWIEQDSSIMLKAADRKYNDPVELTIRQARKIGESLIFLADKLEKYQ